jgi:hypothetical protein
LTAKEEDAYGTEGKRRRVRSRGIVCWDQQPGPNIGQGATMKNERDMRNCCPVSKGKKWPQIRLAIKEGARHGTPMQVMVRGPH